MLSLLAYVEGHNTSVFTRVEFDAEIAKMRDAIKLIQEIGPDERRAFGIYEANTGTPPDEDMAYYLRALIVGLSLH